MVIMVGNHVIKADIHPMAKGESIYDSFNWEEDESSLFGFGVPWQMRTEQRVINTSYQMLMDNAGLATGPQIVLFKGLIKPQDGDWRMTPRKVWVAEDNVDVKDIRSAFQTFDIPARLGDLMQIADQFRQLCDEVTNLPLIAQGAQGANTTQTYQGMALLMNSANVVIRRAVKAFDDHITRPHITRYYDWNMEFNEDESIKGDLKIVARGTTSLLQREQEIVALQQMIQLLPMFAGLANAEEIWKRYLELNNLDPDTFTMQQSPQDQEEEVPLELQLKQMQIEQTGQTKMAEVEAMKYRADREHEARMAKLALDENISLQRLRDTLGMQQQQLDQQADIKALEAQDRQNEMALKAKMGTGI
jgi:hypothetical protein